MSPLTHVVAVLMVGAASHLITVPIIRRLRRQLADTVWQMHHDPQTRLLSRAGLVAEHERWRRTDQPLALVLVDLTDVKPVNDTVGHQAGDDLRRALGARIQQVADLHGGRAARLSGDELAVILPVPASDLPRVAAAILTRVRAPVTIAVDGGHLELQLPARIGAAPGRPGNPLPDLLRHGDLALYHAKRAVNGPPYVVYEPGLDMPAAGGDRRRLRGGPPGRP